MSLIKPHLLLWPNRLFWENLISLLKCAGSCFAITHKAMYLSHSGALYNNYKLLFVLTYIKISNMDWIKCINCFFCEVLQHKQFKNSVPIRRWDSLSSAISLQPRSMSHLHLVNLPHSEIQRHFFNNYGMSLKHGQRNNLPPKRVKTWTPFGFGTVWTTYRMTRDVLAA